MRAHAAEFQDFRVFYHLRVKRRFLGQTADSPHARVHCQMNGKFFFSESEARNGDSRDVFFVKNERGQIMLNECVHFIGRAEAQNENRACYSRLAQLDSFVDNRNGKIVHATFKGNLRALHRAVTVGISLNCDAHFGRLLYF